MNKRIKELAEQADIGFDEKYHWYVSNAALEKFAELIVRECAEEAFKFWCKQIHHYEESARPHIKKHFGVKE